MTLKDAAALSLAGIDLVLAVENCHSHNFPAAARRAIAFGLAEHYLHHMNRAEDPLESYWRKSRGGDCEVVVGLAFGCIVGAHGLGRWRRGVGAVRMTRRVSRSVSTPCQ